MPRSALVAAAMLAALGAAIGPAAATAETEHLPPGSVRVLPARPGAPATLVWKASFDQPPAAQLQAYNVDIARGYRFDARAAAGTCTLEQARAATCPAASRIGSGTGQVTVYPPSGAPQELALGIDFFITEAQRAGDVAGLVLAAHEPVSGLDFALVGRLVGKASGPYGLQLRFADTAAELPADIKVQLHKVNVRFGTQRTAGGTTYHLLTNPRTCSPKGWPFLLTVAYTTGTETYAARGACRA